MRRSGLKRRMAASLTVGFLGAGKMASALASGLVRAGIAGPDAILASDVSALARSSFAEAVAARTTAFNPDVIEFANVIFVAVKPDQVSSILREVAPKVVTDRHLMISIAAGVTIAKMESDLPAGTRIVRVMPNTPALVGASASGFALGKAATPEDGQLVTRLLSAVGVAYQVKESLLDAVTGLSGSGPAYVYLIIEALSDGGVAAGLPRDVATRLAAQTVLGGAKMVLETNLHPGVLKDMVTSPSGTTIEGLHELEKAGVRAALMTAVRTAADRAKKLGQG
jgi:pyrroline-5-carboxylate reductase